jgi:hypothetical protein
MTMRRRDKYILKGALIGGGVLLTIDIFKQWWNRGENGEKLTWDNFNWDRSLERLLLGAGLGGVGGYLFYEYKISQEEKLPFNSDEFLKDVLTSENIRNDPAYFAKVIKERQKLKDWLVKKFGGHLVNGTTEDGGSFVKRTAIASNYDSDIVLPFKKETYSSLKEMFYDVYEEVQHTFSGKATVRKQSRAVELTIECGGDEIYFDIVPGREIKNYNTEKELNLFVRPDWVWQRGSSFKTNFGLQRSITINKPEARQIIKLLKAYRDRNNFDLPTIIIEQCVVEAMSENNFGIHPSVTENLLNCMDFVGQKLNQKGLIDIANSNNNLHIKMSFSERYYIADQLFSDIKQVENNPRYVSEVFHL